MPPPAEAAPLLIVIPAMVTVWPGLTWKIRKAAAATSRWTERTSAPGPLIVRFFVITSSPLVRMIVELAMLNVIVSPFCAAASAWRNEPAPLSPVLVTVMPGGVGVGVDTGVGVGVGVSVADGVPVAVAVAVAVAVGVAVGVAVDVTSSAPMSGGLARESLSKSIVTLPRGVPAFSAGFGVAGAVRLRWRSSL